MLKIFNHLQKKGDGRMLSGEPNKSKESHVDNPMPSSLANHHQGFAERDGAEAVLEDPGQYDDNKRQDGHQQAAGAGDSYAVVGPHSNELHHHYRKHRCSDSRLSVDGCHL